MPSGGGLRALDRAPQDRPAGTPLAPPAWRRATRRPSSRSRLPPSAARVAPEALRTNKRGLGATQMRARTRSEQQRQKAADQRRQAVGPDLACAPRRRKSSPTRIAASRCRSACCSGRPWLKRMSIEIARLDHLLGRLREAAFVAVERRQREAARQPGDQAQQEQSVTAGQRASRRRTASAAGNAAAGASVIGGTPLEAM